MTAADASAPADRGLQRVCGVIDDFADNPDLAPEEKVAGFNGFEDA
jgi:hypothetical protein